MLLTITLCTIGYFAIAIPVAILIGRSINYGMK